MRRSLLSAIGVAAVVATTYATPSSAQTVALGGSSTQYSREALTGNPELTLRNDGPAGAGTTRDKVYVSYTADPDIAAMRTADFTFMLNGGATFATAPTALGLTVGSTADASARISQSFVSGGSAGSSSVTYRVSTVEALSDANTTFTFSVPKISNAASILRGPDVDTSPPALTMRVTVAPSSADALQTQKFPQFPPDGSAATVGVVTLATGHDLFSLTSITPAAGATSTAPVISLSDRTELTGAVSSGNVGTVRTISGFSGGASRDGAVIGRASLSYTENLRPPDATMNSIIPTSSDSLIVTVTGDFESGDILIFTPDTAYAESRVLTISGTTATITLGLDVLTTTPARRTFYYFPASGVIGQKAFSFAFSVRWQASNLATREIPAGSTRVQYAGISTMAHAYAIPNPGNADVGYLRIRCQTEQPCAVFFDCLDQGGGRLGEDGTLQEASIPGRSVRVYQSKTSLPEVLGVSGWTGRLSCNIMSASDVSVQLLVRSGSVGTLTNNTYVSGVDSNPPTP